MTVPKSRPLLLGHRGAGAQKIIPENTLASFDQALADGCDGFEFDVRLTEDGEPVIAHDPRFGKYKIERTLAQQVSTLPRLRDVLKRYQDKAVISTECDQSAPRTGRDDPAGPDLRDPDSTAPLDRTPGRLRNSPA